MAADPFSGGQPPSNMLALLWAVAVAEAAALWLVVREYFKSRRRLDESQEARIEAEQRHAREMAAATEKTVDQARTFRSAIETLRHKPKPNGPDSFEP